MEKLRTFNPQEAIFAAQFNETLAAKEAITNLNCQEIELTASVTEGGMRVYSVTHKKEELLQVADRLAFSRWRDLRDLGLEDVANDILYQHKLLTEKR